MELLVFDVDVAGEEVVCVVVTAVVFVAEDVDVEVVAEEVEVDAGRTVN